MPVQRWSHNVEHGAVVMAYNPCLNPDSVDRLRKLVTGCIRWIAGFLKQSLLCQQYSLRMRPLAWCF